MRDACFIADVAVLPRWMRVWQALDYFAGVHPRFDRAKAEGFLAKTTIGRASKVRELSKGMVAQLHLALVMAIDAKLLVLDEPTLGLDILYRKQFYDSLLNDYFDRSRTIVVTTHQVEEIQDVLTDVMFINRGRIVFDCSMEEFESRYLEVMVNPEQIAAARALKPIHERQVFGRSILLFDRVERQQLAALGDARTPSIADLFVAVLSNQSGAARIVGAPFDLYRPAGRRRRFSARLLDWVDAQPGASARAARHTVRIRGCSDHGDGFYSRDFLLSRRAVRRAPRSQHPVLEVAASFRPHHRALEVRHSPRHFAAPQLRHRCCHAVRHAAAEQRSPTGQRPECRDARG